MARHAAIAATVARAEQYAASARAALVAFPDSRLRRVMEGVTEYTVHRAR